MTKETQFKAFSVDINKVLGMKLIFWHLRFITNDAKSD